MEFRLLNGLFVSEETRTLAAVDQGDPHADDDLLPVEILRRLEASGHRTCLWRRVSKRPRSSMKRATDSSASMA